MRVEKGAQGSKISTSAEMLKKVAKVGGNALLPFAANKFQLLQASATP